ncbi:MAG: SAM-dependent methyltransferase, partial [Syntrophales bacterium]|nr:SAM-dependent methyltransferase [Syntrophales bacterium]
MTKGETARRIRLDRAMVEQGLVATRERARALIMSGAVIINDTVMNKAGSLVYPDVSIRIRGDDNPFVSRGGLKLKHALDVFGIDASGKTALDVGASTGGFTDCLLQGGARRVYSLDVGYGQIAWKLRLDERVKVFERTNIRYFDAALLDD